MSYMEVLSYSLMATNRLIDLLASYKPWESSSELHIQLELTLAHPDNAPFKSNVLRIAVFQVKYWREMLESLQHLAPVNKSKLN